MGKKITREMIEGIREFRKKAEVDRIIVFGSFARGEANEDSDLDLILVGRKFEGKDFHSRFKGLWLKWPLALAVDFLPYTPKEFERLRKQVSIVSMALKEGVEIE